MSTGEPTLIVNPRGDEAFLDFVREQLRDGPMTAAELEGALRTKYPRASVRERGLAGEPRPTWYVYREGTWVRIET